MRKLIIITTILLSAATLRAQGSKELINNHWTFSLGDASSMMGDFSHGTEYFTHFAKAATSGHSKSPTDPAFDDSSWQRVSLPHDWVVDLPYSSEASHSHGYKCIGWNYPRNSVGWYRKHLTVPAEDKGKQVWIEFEGIFRDSEVFCNGFYLGHERSGYSSFFYDLTPYLDYGGDNVITVRCNASTEEGWYYEGAGIYRNVWLHKAGPVMLEPYSLKEGWCMNMTPSPVTGIPTGTGGSRLRLWSAAWTGSDSRATGYGWKGPAWNGNSSGRT